MGLNKMKIELTSDQIFDLKCILKEFIRDSKREVDKDMGAGILGTIILQESEAFKKELDKGGR